MAGYKETPRQKMIAMMYLVLTSLLALNVSKQIIDAFIVVNESMEITNQTFSSKIDQNYDKFQQQLALNPNKVGPYYKQAEEVRRLSQNMINYLDSLKYAVILTTDARTKTVEQAKTTPLVQIRAVDRFTEPTRFFFGRSTTGEQGTAGALKRRIIEFRQEMLGYMGLPSDSDRLGLVTEGNFRNADGKKQTWEQHLFYYTVLAADVAILNKMITEVKNAEFDVVTHLFNKITAEDFKFDQINAKVIPRSRYVFEGEKYEAEVIVAAYDTKQNPEVYYLDGVDTVRDIKNARKVEGQSGIVNLDFPATSPGIKKYAGIIRVLTPSGDYQSYSFKDEYIVAKPSLTVSATKMNVFYTGVQNPVSVSVPGISTEKIQATLNVGSLTPVTGNMEYNYVAQIPAGTTGEAMVSVKAEYEGTFKDMGSVKFRIKRVPDPEAFIANVKDGPVAKNAILAAGGIIPRMPEGFEFDLNFTITSFTFTSVRQGDVFSFQGQGNILTNEMKSFIQAARPGTKVWLENIIAKGPDGNRRLGTIGITIQ
jgi:gliding motility-associated protein GldM